MAQFLFFVSAHVDDLLVIMFIQFLEVVFKECIRGILKRGQTKKKTKAKDAKKKAESPENVESPAVPHVKQQICS